MNRNRDSKLSVCFWGTRGSVSTPGRITEKYGGNTPCVSVKCGDILLIFDAGTGIRNLGIELMDELGKGNPIPELHLFLSHTHWDHIQGLPFFMPSYHKDTRMTIYGSPHKGRFLASILQEQMDYEYFPVSMSSLQADISIREIGEGKISIGPLTVECQEQVFHPGGSVRYRIGLDGKSVVYATDVELDRIFGPTANDTDHMKYGPEFTGFISGTDLLIADAQYTGDEYVNKAGWGHTSIPVLLETAYRSNVRRLAVFHHDPQHSDKFIDETANRKRAEFLKAERSMELFWAREGMTLAV